MSKKITLGSAPEAEVVLHDPAHEAGDRVYRLVALTRKVKDDLRDTAEEIEAILKPYGDDDTVTRKDTARILRLRCDQLNVVLAGADGAPPAGDLLYEGYTDDRIVDDRIVELHENVLKATQDPT